MDKSALRKLYIAKRKLLSVQDVEWHSLEIFARLKKLKIFHPASNLHIFYPIAGKKEINTLLIADWIRREHPSIKLILPKSNLKAHTLQHIVWEESTPMLVNEWGIAEPEYGEEVVPLKIDMVLIPLLVFDVHGNRVGYGKGFYDRFLAQCRPDTLKIGLSYFDPEPILEEVDSLDVPLDYCITPKKVWTFKK